jgi:hypothetical protein
VSAGDRGAYGFRLVPPESHEDLPDLIPQGPEAPEVALEWRLASVLVERERVLDRERVSLGVRGGSGLEIRQKPASITFDLVEAPTPEALVHPLLTTPISVLARWRGDITLHAGAFWSDGAWGVMGDREAGKSTMLATLAAHGRPIVADDLLVIDRGTVRSGPACVDLRPDMAERMGTARFMGNVADRPRFRLGTEPAPSTGPLKGFFVLGWHDRPAVELSPISAGERVQLLYRQEYIGLLGPADPQRVLDLVELPAWRLLRPRDWAATDEAVERMVSLAESQA